MIAQNTSEYFCNLKQLYASKPNIYEENKTVKLHTLARNSLPNNKPEPYKVNHENYRAGYDFTTLHYGENRWPTYKKAVKESYKYSNCAPHYMAPLEINSYQCDWICLIGRDVVIQGKTSASNTTKFINLLHGYGVLTVAALDSNNDLHVVNAQLGG